MSSYDVKALFTSVSVDPALDIIHGSQQQDPHLSNRTFLSIHIIVTLLELCLKSTFFTFQGKYYEQVHGASMGFAMNPLVANLFMEDFEARAISTTNNPPRIWLQYVDDTSVIYKAGCIQQFLTHLNSLNPHIQFTTEAPNMELSHSWTHWFLLDPMAYLSHQFTGNPHIRTNTYIGTAITLSPQNAVYNTLRQSQDHMLR